jgi:hypothetical protein
MKTLLKVLVSIVVVAMVLGHFANQSKTATNTSSAVAGSVATTTAAAAAAATPQATATPVEVSNISWREVDAIYNLRSKKTNLQKAEAWKQFKGKRVVWAGRVSAISEGWFGGVTLQVKMNRETFASDLLIRLPDSEKSKAMPLQKGDHVQFTGVLDDWGSLLPITLNDGEIM